MNHKKNHEAKYGTGFSDNFIPLETLDLSKIDDFDSMLKAMSKTAFGGRTLGEAADVLTSMIEDKDCLKILTLSGAMTVAKMGKVICDMIEDEMVDVVVSTGALMAHGFIEAAGMKHFKYEPGRMNDDELYFKGYDRVYDTLELEQNMDDAEVVVKKVFAEIPEGSVVCSHILNKALGKHLAEHTKGRGVLKSAYIKNVPVYVPAFTDSEIGLDFAIFLKRQEKDGKKQLVYNPFDDLNDYTDRVLKAKKLGIITIGGGVPRNWAQQVGPYLDIMSTRFLERISVREGGYDNSDPYDKKFYYAIRICPEPAHWGGLSGCTYTEGVSWGKFVPKEKGGMHAEVLADATIAWPILIKAVQQRLKKRNEKMK